jgi:hypothetical protein
MFMTAGRFQRAVGASGSIIDHAQWPASRWDMVPKGKRLTAGRESAISTLLDVWHVAPMSVGRQILGSGVAPDVGAATIAAAAPNAAKSIVRQVNLVRMVVLLLDGCGMRGTAWWAATRGALKKVEAVI